MWMMDVAERKPLKIWEGEGVKLIDHVQDYFVVWSGREVKLIGDG